MYEYMRVNTNYSFYADIAREHNLNALSMFEELNELNKKVVDEDTYITYIQELHEKEANIDKNCVIAITFSAMSLEAFIYDYAAIVLGDEYVKKYIDKLDVVAKWVIVPKMITGKELPRHKHCFELLKQTIKLRNEFVHSKSRKYSEEIASELIDKYGTEQMISYSVDAIKAIEELAFEMDLLDKDINALFKFGCKNHK